MTDSNGISGTANSMYSSHALLSIREALIR